jgi:hypothetical protein
MLEPMAQQMKGRAIVAVCDLSENPDVGRRENVESGTTVIYRHGREVARSDGESTGDGTDAAFLAQISELGLNE